MNKLICVILILLLPFVLSAQGFVHNFFGINLSKDWYSLTNTSYLGYWIADNDSLNKTDFITVDFADYQGSFDRIDRRFYNLNFDELLLSFPRGMTNLDLQELQPLIFLGRINYSNLGDYRQKAISDTQALLALIKSEYGEAELNMVREEFSVYKWSSTLYEIVLTCREDELSTTVVYLK